ncbi:hypothetical protein BgiMline_015454 [Biomphalaria glabrata]|uniref:Uncharacterized protein LOC106080011 n=1 Tax=Biomphalaria glabrata TaxID=6526 RepID=A0A9U8EP70_BIOGL|nr:uncharacterized protein LOC106080011 [Biomphalaria glabrata]KAI8757662.1 hypothetical protein BgiMline_008286 [Biomphalaria glabrata]KAI8772925.1 hypothetical protein BgiBS90_026404 [Biomphalaria glabrata]
MFDYAVGDSIQATPTSQNNAQSDFECQVGDTKVNTAKGTQDREKNMQTIMTELSRACSSDFQCQADMNSSDFQCQVKSGQAEGTKPMEMSLPPEHSNRPANKCRTQSKATETRGHTKMSSSASQCNILTSSTSADFQCQAGKGFWDSPHKIKVSASADFQCQASVAQLDFQCQFNDNASCQDQ